MPLSDDQQAQITQAFIQIARQCELPNVDAQSLSMAFMDELEALEDGKPVELQNLFDYLVKDQRISQIDVVDFCIVLQSRQDKVGVAFTMPMQANDVTPERVERVLAQFNKKTAGPAAERKATDAAPAPGASPDPAWDPKNAPRKGTRKNLAIALAVSSVAALGHFVYRETRPDTSLKPIPPQQITSSLPCEQVLSNGSIAICDLNVSAWSPARYPTMREQATRLKANLSSRGVTSVFVRLNAPGRREHGQIVIRVP